MSRRTDPDAVLDAVRDSVLALGVRRTTFAEVARRAGVSRVTLYTHFPDVDTAVATLMTREFGALIDAVSKEVADRATGRQRLVAGAVLLIERLSTHPLYRRVLDVDAELLLPYVIDRLGGTQRAGVEVFRRLLDEGQADGSIRALDTDLAAYVLQLVGQSFVLSRRVTESERSPTAVADELAVMLDAYLRPAPDPGEGRS